MKLYATVKSERASRPANKGSNEQLIITLKFGNKNIFNITLNADSEDIKVLRYSDAKEQIIKYID